MQNVYKFKARRVLPLGSIVADGEVGRLPFFADLK
jgi:hypothetical protein